MPTIASAADLFRALRSSDVLDRLRVLRAIEATPEAALALGPVDGRDLVDELSSLVALTPDSTLRSMALRAILAFSGPTVEAVARRIWADGGRDEDVLAAYHWLVRLPRDEARRFLGDRLGGWDARAQLAAAFLAGAGDLTAAEKLRVSILQRGPSTSPDLPTEATRELWRECLRSRPSRAHDLLVGQGRAGLEAVAAWWCHLDHTSRVWLAGLGHFGGDLGAENDRDVVLAAIGAGSPFPGEFVRHGDPAIRCAAIKHGAPLDDLGLQLQEETNAEVRVAIAARMCASPGERSAEVAAMLVRDPDWQLRAIGAEVFVALGPDAAAVLDTLRDDPSDGVRIAVERVELAWGRGLPYRPAPATRRLSRRR